MTGLGAFIRGPAPFKLKEAVGHDTPDAIGDWRTVPSSGAAAFVVSTSLLLRGSTSAKMLTFLS